MPAVYWGVPLFWLRYRHPDSRFAGVVVLESDTLIRARMKAAASGAVQGLDFVGAHQLDKGSARRIPADMIGPSWFSTFSTGRAGIMVKLIYGRPQIEA